MPVGSVDLPAEEGPAVVQGKVDLQELGNRTVANTIAVFPARGIRLSNDGRLEKNLTAQNASRGVGAAM